MRVDWRVRSVGTLVQKFGGSSLADAARMARAASLSESAYRRGDRLVVVVSAQGDTTDNLLNLADQISVVRPAREIDQLLATGEIASAALMAMALHDLGVPAVSLTGAQAGICVAGPYNAGVVADVDTTALDALLDRGNVAVVAGFQGADRFGNVLTLGRGGSDTTAVALAAKLSAQCEIYTDVDGIYTADPRLIGDARLLPVVTAPVMAEMAFAGARVMHSRAVELAALTNVDIHLRGTMSRAPGTTIAAGAGEVLERQGCVVAVAHDLRVARVLVQAHKDLAQEVFEVLAAANAPADLVARSGSGEAEFRIGFTTPAAQADRIQPALREVASRHGGRVEINRDVGKVSLIGTGLLNRPEITSRMLAVLSHAGIQTSWVSAAQLRTSVTVPAKSVREAVVLLHQEFELQRTDYDISALVTS